MRDKDDIHCTCAEIVNQWNGGEMYTAEEITSD